MNKLPPDSDTLVWHYTNASGLLGMIEKRQLWATHYRFMNDSLEGSVLEHAVQKLINSSDLIEGDRALIREMYRTFDGIPMNLYSRTPNGNRFLLCGANSGDELTLWRNYAREEISFAVGIDSESPLGVIPPKQGLLGNPDISAWKAVDYQPESSILPDSHMSRIKAGLKLGDEGDKIRRVSDLLRDIFCMVKSSAFKDERETRVVCVTDNIHLWRFRSGNFGITPYVALGAAESWGETSKGEDVLPIRAIRVSSNAKDADILALNALLEANGFEGDVDTEEGFDHEGRPIIGSYSEIEPPVKILQASNSLRL